MPRKAQVIAPLSNSDRLFWATSVPKYSRIVEFHWSDRALHAVNLRTWLRSHHRRSTTYPLGRSGNLAPQECLHAVRLDGLKEFLPQVVKVIATCLAICIVRSFDVFLFVHDTPRLDKHRHSCWTKKTLEREALLKRIRELDD
jgi:hypothetical protein